MEQQQSEESDEGPVELAPVHQHSEKEENNFNSGNLAEIVREHDAEFHHEASPLVSESDSDEPEAQPEEEEDCKDSRIHQIYS